MPHAGQCTNISIGYHQQHRREEWLDVHYLQSLRWAVIEVFSQDAFTLSESTA
jgi:di/tripeptidase